MGMERACGGGEDGGAEPRESDRRFEDDQAEKRVTRHSEDERGALDRDARAGRPREQESEERRRHAENALGRVVGETLPRREVGRVPEGDVRVVEEEPGQVAADRDHQEDDSGLGHPLQRAGESTIRPVP